MRLAAVLTFAVLVAASPAEAATFGFVQQASCEERYCTPPFLPSFAGAPGEANRVVVQHVGAEIVAADAAAPVAPGARCRAVDAHTVACPAAELRIDTGDGDDVVDLASSPPETGVALGPGDDRFTAGAVAALRVDGGDGADEVVGASGNDILAGGLGPDVVVAGAGDDEIYEPETVRGDDPAQADDAPASDRLDGGPGRDTLSLSGRGAATVVDLAAGRAGTLGEVDVLSGFEDVEGGNGDDRLRGDDGPNRLSGTSGSDVISGRGGDDRLTGGSAIDDRSVLLGGPGDDFVFPFGAGRLADGGPGDDVLITSIVTAVERCGTGRDALRYDGGPIVAHVEGCERVASQVLRIDLPTRPGAPFRLFCRRLVWMRETCRTRVTVADARWRHGRTTRLRLRPGGTALVHLPVPAGRRYRLVATTHRRLHQPPTKIRLAVTRGPTP